MAKAVDSGTFSVERLSCSLQCEVHVGLRAVIIDLLRLLFVSVYLHAQPHLTS